MIRKHLKQLLLSSAVILLPVVAGLLLWDQLPTSMNIHWGADGQPDGAAGKAFAVFAPALLILAAHWLCILISGRDMKKQTPKAAVLVLWICPALSLCIHSIMYTVALGLELNMGMLLFMPLGILFAVMGNYMPKFRRNSTMGIKTIWSLADDENWNATHRFAGKTWVAGGLLVMILSCLPWDWAVGLTFIVIFAFAFAPMIYSWQYHKKQVQAGTAAKPVPQDPRSKAITKYTLIFVAIVFVFVGIVLFSGTITTEFGDTSFTISATYYEDLTIAYADIDSIELREQNVPGTRVWGYGSFRLLLGTFQNEEFGNHTRYTYVNPESCIILTSKGKTLVFAAEDANATREIYENLLERIK